MVIYMDLGQIISNSFKYPFYDFKRLVMVCILFALLLILPIGLIFNSDVVQILGLIAILAFMLIFPGFGISIIRKGSVQSEEIPSLRIGRNIVDTLKLLVLRILYMLVPIIIFLVMIFALGIGISGSGLDFQISYALSSFGTIFIISYIIYLIFSLLSVLAKARFAAHNSLVEALKIHKVLKDISDIGIGRVIGWFILMGVLLGILSFVCIFILFIPYVGFILYLCFALPIILIIDSYSLGLLYSSISNDYVDVDDGEYDLDEFEKEIKRLKYLN